MNGIGLDQRGYVQLIEGKKIIRNVESYAEVGKVNSVIISLMLVNIIDEKTNPN